MTDPESDFFTETSEQEKLLPFQFCYLQANKITGLWKINIRISIWLNIKELN